MYAPRTYKLVPVNVRCLKVSTLWSLLKVSARWDVGSEQSPHLKSGREREFRCNADTSACIAPLVFDYHQRQKLGTSWRASLERLCTNTEKPKACVTRRLCLPALKLLT